MTAGRDLAGDEREAHARLVAALVSHAVRTHRRPDVRWTCDSTTRDGRGACRMLRAWRVADPGLSAVVELPPDRRSGNSRIMRHNDKDPARYLSLDDFLGYWGFEWGRAEPAQIACNHYRLTIPVEALTADLSDVASTRSSVVRRLSDSLAKGKSRRAETRDIVRRRNAMP